MCGELSGVSHDWFMSRKYSQDNHICKANLFNLENLVLWARSESNGFAVKDNELFWSTGVLES